LVDVACFLPGLAKDLSAPRYNYIYGYFNLCFENANGKTKDTGPNGSGHSQNLICYLTLILLTWRIWWAPNNASRWQMGFNWAFKGL